MVLKILLMYLISVGTAKMKLAILVFLYCEEGKELGRHFLQTLQIKLDKEDFLAKLSMAPGNKRILWCSRESCTK